MAKYTHIIPAAVGSLALLGVSATLPGDAAAEGVGRVVAVRGSVTAQSPGGEVRQLECNDPVFAGDRIETSENGRLGVLSDGIYAGMNEKTSLAFESTEDGAPKLDLKRGHLRLLDGEGAASARIVTPGLLAYDAGRDTEALVFPEKAWTVSMVCPYDGPVAVTRVARGDGSRPAAGTCAVAKPKEPLFVADASHPRLPVIDDDCRLLTPVAGRASDHFGSPADVALGPDVAAAAFGAASLAPPIGADLDTQSFRSACEIGNSCSPVLTVPGFRGAPFPFEGPPRN